MTDSPLPSSSLPASGGGALIPADQWTKIVASFDKTGVPLPFVQEIFLLDCTVAGTTHVQEIEAKTADVVPGTVLAFRREPANPQDPLAILILNGNGEKIGYVPQQKNEVLAHLMDGGKLLFGRVEHKDWRGKWLHIRLRVFMRDL
ncbi:HIRAN domain-containing protein [bacterium]|nr:HIRAN domain-containing protein [bacterium]MBP1589651.1 HIRAN domain-containing protein [Kiritimatiellia bacterium]